MSADIRITLENGLGSLILDRPQAMNALSLGMVRTLAQTLMAWRTNPDVRAVLIRSDLPKAFCAGGD
ncbi:enoyl-CoA hydratase/isomerase family protein, partial [Herminiimonas sp.]|uniref:enoyl-CoA hydratase/isomerase family protein n=1 Tax=Herminiimonas sp. TaxID=1926289 RepID=UPI00271CCD87